MYLNLGCGDKATHGRAPWVNVDSWPGCEPDIVADILHLDFEDGCAEMIYAGHVIEHLDYTVQVPLFVAELARLLAPGGQVLVVGPDAEKVRSRPEWSDWIERVDEGSTEHPGSLHLWKATGEATVKAMRECFPEAREVDIRTPAGFWPIASRIEWQFAVFGKDI